MPRFRPATVFALAAIATAGAGVFLATPALNGANSANPVDAPPTKVATATASDAKAPEAAEKDKKSAAPRPVRAEVAAFSTFRPDRTLAGTVRARYETDYGFRVAGKLAERRVQVGDRVNAGQVLALLDNADLTLQREQALAELAAAKSSETQALAEEKRVVDLRKHGWSTESTLDRQRAAADEAEGRRKRAERAVSLATNALSYAELKADKDGVVTAVLAEPGQVVATGTPVVRVALTGEREAVVSVPEAEIERVRHGVGARVTLWSDPDRVYEARLRELAPSADALTRTYLARFTIQGLPPDAPIGMTTTLTLTDTEGAKVVRLPLAALFNQGQGSAVYVVGPDGALTLRPVTVAGYDSREVSISGGLSEGETVVTLGVHMLQPGEKVRVLPRQG